MSAVTLVQAARKFGDFYVPRFEIAASGEGIDPRILRDVTQVTYNDSITEIDSFDITVANWDTDPRKRTFKYVGAETTVKGSSPVERLFNPCVGDFELKLGYGSELVTIVKGSTTSLEPSFPAGGAPTLTVRMLNALHKLRGKQHRDHWPNARVAAGKMKISRIAEDIGQRRIEGETFPMPIRISKDAMRDEPLLDYVAQDNVFDIDFLMLEARKIGYVVYVDLERQGKQTKEVLYFGPSDSRHAGVPRTQYELEWGLSLIDFAPKLSTANQVKSVTVKSWDRQKNRAIAEKVSLKDPGITCNQDLLELLDVPGCRPREEVVANEPMYTKEQARRRAQALLSDKLKQMVEGSGSTVGLPDLRAGQQVLIRGLGARFSGIYFVTKTTHTVNDSGYVTRFTARREAPLPAGSRGLRDLP
jgi:phage protein D